MRINRPTKILSQATGERAVYTSKEAEELGIPYKSPPPPPKTCKYCGKTLYHEGIAIAGVILIWRTNEPRHCDCPKSIEFWKKWDAEQAEKEKQRIQQEEQEQRKQKIQAILGKSGIKQRYLSRTFDKFIVTGENRKAYQIAKSYADNWEQNAKEGKGLYLEGTCGTGKTHLAVAISLELINHGIPVVCKTSIDLLADIKRSYEQDSTVSEEDVLSVYKTADLLVIDDLGKERATEWSVPILYSIINDRYEAMLPTIITTNYNSDVLAEKLTVRGDRETADAIVSRFVGSADCVTMAWRDYRKRKKGE